MSRIRLYLDEDAMEHGLVIAFRARLVDVLTASDCGMVNRDDEEHLEYASRSGRALYSFNIRDYARIDRQWIENGREHSGIILAPQQRLSIGEQQRRLLQLLSRRSAAEMRSQIEYLSNWDGQD